MNSTKVARAAIPRTFPESLRPVRLEFPMLSGESVPSCVASAQCGPRRVVARHGARPHRRGMCAAGVARQPPGIRQTPGGRRLRAHDCPCWRVTPLWLSTGSPRAVGFPSHASPYQLARRRRPSRSGVLAGITGLTNAWRFRGSWSYTHAALSQDSPGLLEGGADAFEGDRLSGAPRQQGSLLASSWGVVA